MKNKYMIYVILLVILLSFVLGVTYSYLVVKINGIEETSTINVEGGKLSITYANNSGDIIIKNATPGSSTTKQFTLTGVNDTKSNSKITDTDLKYKIGIVIDNNTFSNDALTYSLTVDSSSSTNGKLADNSNGTIKSTGTQFIGNGYFSIGANNDKHIYNLTISFPETDEDQSIDQGATFACHITIVHDINLVASNYLKSLNKDTNSLEIDDTEDKNLRYVGANPNNYLSFNNETWRIIGVFNNITTIDEEGNEKTESLVKIIRDESLGSYSWDISTTSDSNDWSKSDIMQELNGDYIDITKTTGSTSWYGYNDRSASAISVTYDYSKNIKSSVIDKIATVRWNLGGPSYGTSTSPQGGPIHYYNKEKANGVYGDHAKTWDGKIALMYPSDYGYASTNTSCRNLLNSNNCKNDNWLFNSEDQWTLSPNTNFKDNVMYASKYGAINFYYSYDNYCVRPTLFLKSDVEISEGTGTKTDPYKLFTKPSFSDDSWETIANNIKSGKGTLYNVGDEKEVEIKGTNYTVRLANNSTPEECNNDDFSQSACGFVVEFVDIVEQMAMNTTATNVGGWPATAIKKYLDETFIYNLPSDLQKVITTTKTISGHGKTASEKNFVSENDKLYLLSPHEIWSDKMTNDTAYDVTRQLDYYANNNVSTSANESYTSKQYNGSTTYWWLRTANASYYYYFYIVRSNGYASNPYGLAPAFRIG